jgi:ubiquinone/menaquinone biosynthesis C-methylase UbiE
MYPTAHIKGTVVLDLDLHSQVLATRSINFAMSAPVSAQEGLAGFASVIDIYEHRIGHVCRAVASHLPTLFKAFPSTGGTVLDNACGTGAASEEFLKKFPTAKIFAADVVPPMVQSFKAIIASKPELQKQVEEVRLEDAQNLTFADDTFDASITNFGIFFFPDPVAGAKQIHRTLKPGGTAVITLWKTFGFKSILWEIQDRVKPANPLTELPLMEPWCDPALLEKTLKEGGFKLVDFTVVKEGLWGKDKKDFELVLLENLGAMTARNWTDEERAKLPAMISQVIDEQQEELCVTDGAKVGCMMEAWVAVVTK